MRVLFTIAALLICSVASAQLELTHGPAGILAAGTEVNKVGDRYLVRSSGPLAASSGELILAETEAANVEFSVTDQARVPVAYDSIPPNGIFVSTPGKMWVEVTAIDFAKNIYGRKTIVVEVGVGPGPPPGPGPTPPPGPAPIDGVGLRVLLIYETSESHSLTKDQQQILFGPVVRDFLNANCAKGDDRVTADWRLLDKDTIYTDPSNKFAKALLRPRTSIPWLVISNGTSGYEGPLPATPSETVELVKRFMR